MIKLSKSTSILLPKKKLLKKIGTLKKWKVMKKVYVKKNNWEDYWYGGSGGGGSAGAF